MAKKKSEAENNGKNQAEPVMAPRGEVIQPYGKLVKMHLGLSMELCAASAKSLNAILADTITLRDLYKKHHWQISGQTFYQLHLLYDKHFDEQSSDG